MKNNLLHNINIQSSWEEMTIAGYIFGGANSHEFDTGVWRTQTPKWNPDKCKQCMLCFLVCPDSSIPIINNERVDFDFAHCKGCGICVKVCPFNAITIQIRED